MARYDYRCSSCDEVFEVEHPMLEHPDVFCPNCGKPAYKVFTPSGIEFHGTGFYNTDVATSSVKASSATSAAGSAGTASSTTSNAKASSESGTSSSTKGSSSAKTSSAAKPATGPQANPEQRSR